MTTLYYCLDQGSRSIITPCLDGVKLFRYISTAVQDWNFVNTGIANGEVGTGNTRGNAARC